MKNYLILLFLVHLSSLNVYPQALNVNDTSRVGDSFMSASLKYTSDYLFMGRTDSLEAPYLTPSLTYFHQSGFFVKGAFSYLLKSEENRVDVTLLAAGYDFSSTRLSAGGSFTTFFFNDLSYAVPSAMSGFLNTYVGYDFMLLEVNANGSLSLSEDLDAFLGLEIARMFFAFKGRMVIMPYLESNAGSQNYYNEYYGARSSQITKGKGFGKGPMGGNGFVGSEIAVEEASKFQILDYEFGIWLTYKVDPIRISINPEYVIPVNPSTVTVNQDVVFEESLDNLFFWSASVTYLF